ncbi:MAG: recombinase RecT [Candidatus Micrarchaeia archaeon]|jgi:recombination protein RecT
MAEEKTNVPAVRKDVSYGSMQPAEKMSYLERRFRALIPRFETMLGDPVKAKMLMYVALNAFRKEPKLLKCSEESIIMSINHCSDLGLFPNTPDNHAYLIPYGTECKVMPDYKGYIALAYQIPKVVKIWAELVYKGDKFHHELGANPKLVHIPNYEIDRTLDILTGAYAVIKYSDGEVQWIYMTRKELDKVRAVSQAKNGDAWKNWPEEMYRKAPVRRLMKFSRSSPRMMKAVALDNAAMVGEPQNMPMVTEGAKETEFEVVQDDAEPPQSKSDKLADELKVKNGNGGKKPEPEKKAPDAEALRKELTDLLESNADVLGADIVAHYPVGRIKLWKADALQDAINEVNKQLVAVGQPEDDGDPGPELPL